MRGLFLIWLLSIVGGCSGGDGGDTPPVDAGGTVPPDVFAIVQEQLITPQGWSEEVVRIYGMDTPLMPGQTVGPVLDVDGNDIAPTTITEPTWFFWADTTPYQLFSHPTVFIYMDEDGSNLRVEQQEWFPVVDGLAFIPDEPVWGPAQFVDESSTGGAMAPIRTMRGEPCGEAHAVIFQGFRYGGLMGSRYREVEGGPVLTRPADQGFTKTVKALQASLMARDYIVHMVTPDQELDPAARVALLRSELTALTMGERKSQIDIFYLGHGSKQGEWVITEPRHAPARLRARDLVDMLGDAATPRINLAIESCNAETFTTAAPALADHVATSMVADSFFHVLASTTHRQPANVTLEDGAFYTERLLAQLEMEPAGKPFEYSDATMPAFTLSLADGTRPRQSPPVPFATSPSAPLLFYDREYDECQVVADLPEDAPNERRVTIRGAGFGDLEGTVELYPWDITGGALDAPVTLPVFFWSDQTVVVEVPMRSRGFPGDAKNLPTHTDLSWPTESRVYGIGAYYVRVASAAGAWSAPYRDFRAETTPPEHFYAPQLIHIAAQVRQQTWTPSYAMRPDGIEFSEMWLRMSPSSPELGTATVLLSELATPMDPTPTLAFLSDPLFIAPDYFAHSGSEPHTTAPGALARHMGMWAYDLPAAERDLMTAMDTRFPMVNYWGFRQQFAPLTAGPPATDYLRDTGDWTFILIYD